MSATSEVPAAFRHAAGDRGPSGSSREGIRDIRSRRRLVRYLVQADIRKRGADTAARQHLVGPRPAAPDGRVCRLRDDRRRAGRPRTTRSSSSRRSCPGSGSRPRSPTATQSIVRKDQLIKQIQFPKIVLPVAATTAGIVSFAFGLVALGLLMLFYPDRISPYLLLIPVIAAVQFVFTLACASWSRPATCSSATSATSRATSCACGGSCRPACTAWPRSTSSDLQEQPGPAHAGRPQPVRHPVRGLPDGDLRHADRPARPAELRGPGGAARGRSIVFLGLTTIVFKRLEPNFAKVI